MLADHYQKIVDRIDPATRENIWCDWTAEFRIGVPYSRADFAVIVQRHFIAWSAKTVDMVTIALLNYYLRPGMSDLVKFSGRRYGWKKSA